MTDINRGSRPLVLTEAVDIGHLTDTFKEIERKFGENEPRTEEEIEVALETYRFRKILP